MKIALVIQDYNSHGGGAERWTDRFAQHLLTCGHEVHIVSRRIRNPPDGAQCHVINAWARSSFSRRLVFAKAAEQFLRQQQFDVIHDMGDGWYFDIFMPHHGTRAGGFIQNTALVPAFLRWARILAQKVLPRYWAFQTLERRQFEDREGRRWIALSNMIRSHMVKYYRVPTERIDVIYNGIDTSFFRPSSDPQQRKHLRRALGFDRVTLFLIVAHNFKLKGVDTLVKAMARMAKENQKAGLIVVGAGDVRSYRRMARAMGCSNLIRFVGDQPDPLAYYHAADVYVQPTFYDPCSLVVLEALACGLPVITTKQNGAGELIDWGVQGLIIDRPDDSVSLYRAMCEYLDPVIRAEASTAARALAEQHSFERNCEEILKLYSEAAGLRYKRAA